MRLDGRALAFDYCLEYNKVHYVLKTGYDPAYERFSPGKVLRQLMLERAFSEGIATYDFGGAPEPWKQKWTNAYCERQFLRMFAPTTLGSLDRAVFVGRRLAVELTKRAAQSPLLPERSRRLVEHALTTRRRRIDRRSTS